MSEKLAERPAFNKALEAKAAQPDEPFCAAFIARQMESFHRTAAQCRHPPPYPPPPPPYPPW
jgi:hypothetical protein